MTTRGEGPNPLLPKLSAARRELLKAVDRASKVDLREGHYVEAIRRTEAVRDEAERLIQILDKDRS